MNWKALAPTEKKPLKVLTNVLATALVVGVPFPGLAQRNLQNKSMPMTGLSSLPVSAEGPISAALGKDDSSYWIHPNAEGLRGENSRHALVTEFTGQGAEVRSHNLRWTLETRGYGYGDALHLTKSVAPQTNANRVEYRRDELTEWYENGPLGLEQGFTLAHRSKKASAKPLTLELALKGDLVAAVEQEANALDLKSKDGKTVLRYAGLKARDAAGRELKSWLEVRGDRLLVRVDDRGARYPLAIDPWIQQAELTASDGLGGDAFGLSVAVSGNMIVVGAPYHPANPLAGPGAAYVFVESSGEWSQQAELTASDGGPNNVFGWSVAVDGTTVVVGAPYAGGGAAYVFAGSAGTWSQQAELIPSDVGAHDWFGYSVAISGSTVAVGSPQHTPVGAAYVFAESGGTWSQQAELTSSDGAAGDDFGYSVAVSGSTVVAGAYEHAVGSNPDQGAAYVFVESGGTWDQQAELTASDGAAGDFFGFSVAADGSTAIVGAINHAGMGAAYVFAQNGTTWSQQAELTASDGGGDFGYFVAINAGTAVAAAISHTFGSNTGQGAAYVFIQSGATWSQQGELTDGGGTEFGFSVAVNGGTVVAGNWGQKVGSNVDQGAAYVFGSSGALYTLAAAPSSLGVKQGEQATSTITIAPWDGFSGTVSLSVIGLPKGITAAFSPNPATGATTLTLIASKNAATGTAEVLIVGTSGNLVQTAPLPLTVLPEYGCNGRVCWLP
jgi:hypothetical protein